MSEPTSFDRDVAEAFRKVITEQLSKHPELRSVAIVFDWRGSLNDRPDVIKGMWLNDRGRVEDPAAVFGGLQNTALMLRGMSDRADECQSNMRELVRQLGNELHARIGKMKGKADGDDTPAAAGPPGPSHAGASSVDRPAPRTSGPPAPGPRG